MPRVFHHNHLKLSLHLTNGQRPEDGSKLLEKKKAKRKNGVEFLYKNDEFKSQYFIHRSSLSVPANSSIFCTGEDRNKSDNP
mgnify:CR=1 FL=1